MTNEKRKPVEHVDLYPVRAAIWRNESDEGKAFYSFTVERVYEKDGNYDSTHSFGLSDALLLAKVADIVDSRIRTRYAADRSAAKAEANLNSDVA